MVERETVVGRVLDLASRARQRLRRELRSRIDRLSRLHRGTFANIDLEKGGLLAGRFGFIDPEFVGCLIERCPGVASLVLQQAESALAHRFDLLGSGPTVVAHGIQCRGIDGICYPPARTAGADTEGLWLSGRINRSNLGESQRLWRLVSPGYTPLDWQLDFKSGYRWSEATWHGDIRIAPLPGADIKVPWELSRLQHLPVLALACHFARANVAGFRDSGVYAVELRNQILDFIAANPPGFGANWACAMDVGIRCANLLVAHDIAVACLGRLDDPFERCLASSIFSHARHVHRNLEWSPVYRGNHYLANILGLLFAAGYLPASREVDGWLVFASRELLNEIEYQFHADGSSFEASTCYHRLSAEMALWGCALLAGLAPERASTLRSAGLLETQDLCERPNETGLRDYPSDRTQDSLVPAWCWQRLERMADFTQALTRPDGMVVQFGDNDSGRFIALCSSEQLRASTDPSSIRWSLDHQGLVESVRSVVTGGEAALASRDSGALIISRFAGVADRGARREQRTIDSVCLADEGVWADCIARYERAPNGSRTEDRFTAGDSTILDGIQRAAFPGMGCYVFRGEQVYLAIRCGEIGIRGLGAHAHCDQLAIELVMDGVDCVRDPGTCVYTALPRTRNRYRSASVHHVPHVEGREPADLSRGLFDLRGAAEGECIYFGERGFIGRHRGYGVWVYRIVAIESQAIRVLDYSEDGLKLSSSRPIPTPFSPGYGRPST